MKSLLHASAHVPDKKATVGTDTHSCPFGIDVCSMQGVVLPHTLQSGVAVMQRIAQQSSAQLPMRNPNEGNPVAAASAAADKAENALAAAAVSSPQAAVAHPVTRAPDQNGSYRQRPGRKPRKSLGSEQPGHEPEAQPIPVAATTRIAAKAAAQQAGCELRSGHIVLPAKAAVTEQPASPMAEDPAEAQPTPAAATTKSTARAAAKQAGHELRSGHIVLLAQAPVAEHSPSDVAAEPVEAQPPAAATTPAATTRAAAAKQAGRELNSGHFVLPTQPAVNEQPASSIAAEPLEAQPTPAATTPAATTRAAAMAAAKQAGHELRSGHIVLPAQAPVTAQPAAPKAAEPVEAKPKVGQQGRTNSSAPCSITSCSQNMQQGCRASCFASGCRAC